MLKKEIETLKDREAKQYRELAEYKSKIAVFKNEQFPRGESVVLHRCNSTKRQV